MKTYNSRKNFRYFIPLATAMPSVIIGAIAMNFHGVSRMIYGQNVACLLIAWLVSCFAVSFKQKANKRIGLKVFLLISLLIYILTFIDGGIEGVHRWISLGSIRLYASSIIQPIFIIKLGDLFSNKNNILAITITIVTFIILFLQPDASQLTAFVVPMIIIIICKVKARVLRYVLPISLITLVVLSWIFLDGLAPVPYVEEIVQMVSDMGIIWSILGLASLAILPLPFIRLAPRSDKLLSIGVGLYYIIVIISTWFGNFPVPLMGFGVSPIIGYFIAITWLI